MNEVKFNEYKKSHESKMKSLDGDIESQKKILEYYQEI